MFLTPSFLFTIYISTLLITEITVSGETVERKASREDQHVEQPHLIPYKYEKNFKKRKLIRLKSSQRHSSSENLMHALEVPKYNKKTNTKLKNKKDTQLKPKNIFKKLWDKIKIPFTKDSSDKSSSKKSKNYKNKYYRKRYNNRGNYRRKYKKNSNNKDDDENGNKKKKYSKNKWYANRKSGTSGYKRYNKYYRNRKRYNKNNRNRSSEEKQNRKDKKAAKPNRSRQPIEHTHRSMEEHDGKNQVKEKVMDLHSLESIHIIKEDQPKNKPVKKAGINNEDKHDKVIKLNKLMNDVNTKNNIKESREIHKNNNEKSKFNSVKHNDLFLSREQNSKYVHAVENTAIHKDNTKLPYTPSLNSNVNSNKNLKLGIKSTGQNIIQEISNEKLSADKVRQANSKKYNPITSRENFSAENKNDNVELGNHENSGNTITKKKGKSKQTNNKNKIYKIDGKISKNKFISVEHIKSQEFNTKDNLKNNLKKISSLSKELKRSRKTNKNDASKEENINILKQTVIDGINRAIALSHQQSIEHNLPSTNQNGINENIISGINTNEQQSKEKLIPEKNYQENKVEPNEEFQPTNTPQSIPEEDSAELQEQISEENSKYGIKRKSQNEHNEQTEVYKYHFETSTSDNELIPNGSMEKQSEKPSDFSGSQEKTGKDQRNNINEINTLKGDHKNSPTQLHVNLDHTEETILKTNTQHQINTETGKTSVSQPEKYNLNIDNYNRVNKVREFYNNIKNTQDRIQNKNNDNDNVDEKMKNENSQEMHPIIDQVNSNEGDKKLTIDGVGQQTHSSSERMDIHDKTTEVDEKNQSKYGENIQGIRNKDKKNSNKDELIENSLEKDSKFRSLDNFIENINEDKETSLENGDRIPVKDDDLENEHSKQDVTINNKNDVDTGMGNKEETQKNPDGSVYKEYDQEPDEVQGSTQHSIKDPPMNIVQDTADNERYQHEEEISEENTNVQNDQEVTNLEKPPTATGNENIEGITENGKQNIKKDDDDYYDYEDEKEEEEEEEPVVNADDDKPLFPNWYPKPPRNLFDRLFGTSATTVSTPPSEHEKEKSENKGDYNYEDNNEQESKEASQSKEKDDEQDVPETTTQTSTNSSLPETNNSTQQPAPPDYQQHYQDENLQYYDSYEQFLANQESDELFRYTFANSTTLRGFEDLGNQTATKSENQNNNFTNVNSEQLTMVQQNTSELNSINMLNSTTPETTNSEIYENINAKNISLNHNQTIENLTNDILTETNNNLDYIYRDIENEINNLVNGINGDPNIQSQ